MVLQLTADRGEDDLCRQGKLDWTGPEPAVGLFRPFFTSHIKGLGSFNQIGTHARYYIFQFLFYSNSKEFYFEFEMSNRNIPRNIPLKMYLLDV